MVRLGAGSLTVALLGASCQLASGPAPACREGLALDGGAAGGADGGSGGGPDGGGVDAGATDAAVPEGGVADGGQVNTGGSYCSSCQSPITCGEVHHPLAVSVTGLAASARHARAYYLHNGPPDVARFFAVDETGADLGTYNLPGAANLGWEDMAVGPCPTGSCLFIADIGDPGQVRGQYAILRIAEPATLSAGERLVAADTFPFAYPDGSHDAAAVLVHPTTGTVTVITRDPGGAGARLYDLPSAQPGQPVTATARGLLEQLGLGVSVTSASIRRDGRVVLRTTRGATVFAPPAGGAATMPVSALLRGAGCPVTTATETAGEAITWIGSGRGILTLGRGAAPPLDYVFCTGP